MAHKLMQNELCEDEFVQLNFQLMDNERIRRLTFVKRSSYEAGNNILLNIMHILNDKIDKRWLTLSHDTFKVKCKELFLN